MPKPVCALAFACAGREGLVGNKMNKKRKKAIRRSAMAPTTLRIIVYYREEIKRCIFRCWLYIPPKPYMECCAWMAEGAYSCELPVNSAPHTEK